MFDLYGDPVELPGGASKPSLPIDAQAPAPPPLDAELKGPKADMKGDLIRGILRHWWLLLPVYLCMAGGGAFVVMTKMKPAYKAEAVLEIAPILPNMVYTGEEWRAVSIHSFFDNYVRTMTHRFKEQALLEAVVADLEEQGVQWAYPSTPRVAWPAALRGRLAIVSINETHLMTVSTGDTRPEVVAPVVNTTVKHFIESIRKESEDIATHRFAALGEERARLVEELKAAHARLDEIAPVIGSAMLDSRQNLPYDQVNKLEEGRIKILVDLARAEGVLVSAAAQAAGLLAVNDDQAVLRELADDPTLREARTELEALEARTREATLGMSERHPERALALRTVKEVRERVADLEKETLERLLSIRRAERRAEAQAIMQQARESVDGARKSYQILEEALDGARGDLREHGRAMLEGLQARSALEKAMDRIYDIDTQLEETRIELRAPPRVSVRSPAVTPGEPDKDKRPMMAGAAVIFSLVGVLGMAFVLEKLRGLLASESQLAGVPVPVARIHDVRNAAVEVSFRVGEAGRESRRVAFVPVDAKASATAERLANGLAALRGRRAVRLDLVAEELFLVDEGDFELPNGATPQSGGAPIRATDEEFAEGCAGTGRGAAALAGRVDDVHQLDIASLSRLLAERQLDEHIDRLADRRWVVITTLPLIDSEGVVAFATRCDAVFLVGLRNESGLGPAGRSLMTLLRARARLRTFLLVDRPKRTRRRRAKARAGSVAAHVGSVAEETHGDSV